MLQFIAGKRLARGAADGRRRHERAARGAQAAASSSPARHDLLPVADRARPARGRLPGAQPRPRPTATFGPHVVRRQRSQLRRSLRGLQREGFRHVYVLTLARGGRRRRDRARAAVDRPPRRDAARSTSSATCTAATTSWSRCSARLGYAVGRADDGRRDRSRRRPGARRCSSATGRPRARLAAASCGSSWRWSRPARRSACRATTTSSCVRKLSGRTCRSPTASPRRSSSSAGRAGRSSRRGRATFLDGLVSHYVLDDGKLVVAHAGHEGELPGPRLGRGARVRAVRRDDRRDRRVRPAGALQLGGRVPRRGHGRLRPHAGAEPEWLNHTINIDTGCVFGGKLTALRWPERELVSVPAAAHVLRAGQAVPADGAAAARLDAAAPDDVLDLDDVPASGSSRRG